MLFLLSREGEATTQAQAAIDQAGSGSTAGVCDCPPALALLLARGEPKFAKCIGAATLGDELDMFAYMLF